MLHIEKKNPANIVYLTYLHKPWNSPNCIKRLFKQDNTCLLRRFSRQPLWMFFRQTSIHRPRATMVKSYLQTEPLGLPSLEQTLRPVQPRRELVSIWCPENQNTAAVRIVHYSLMSHSSYVYNTRLMYCG